MRALSVHSAGVVAVAFTLLCASASAAFERYGELPFAQRGASSAVRRVNGLNLNEYHSYDEVWRRSARSTFRLARLQIMSFLKTIHNKRVTVATLGTSTEGRRIPIVKVRRPPLVFTTVGFRFADRGTRQRRRVEGDTRRRTRSCSRTYLRSHSSASHRPCESRGGHFARSRDDKKRLQLADSTDWPAVDLFVIPIVNPDGYEYSRTTNRMWRSTRSGASRCGTDLNRNFPFKFGVSGGRRRRKAAAASIASIV